jgi:TolA-binding protein
MNRMSTYVTLCALVALLGEHSISTYAYAQMPTGALPQIRTSELFLAASPSSPVTTPTIPLGVAQQLTILKQRADADEADIATLKTKLAADDKNIKTLQSQVSTLQSQVSTLQGRAQAQQASLQKLQTQFANHYRTFSVYNPGHTSSGLITFHCPGIGQPCTPNASVPSDNNDYGMIIYTSHSISTPASTSTVSTSGPKTN